jgi:hypothetical protein
MSVLENVGFIEIDPLLEQSSRPQDRLPSKSVPERLNLRSRFAAPRSRRLALSQKAKKGRREAVDLCGAR